MSKALSKLLYINYFILMTIYDVSRYTHLLPDEETEALGG